MNPTYLDQIKIIEIAQILIREYSYQEIIIKNVDGIFLQNKSAKYQLIRLSSLKFKDENEFNNDLYNIKKIINEFQTISFIEQPRCLCFYFGGYIKEMVDNVYSISITSQQSLIYSDLINNDLPILGRKFNYQKFDNNQIFTNGENNEKGLNTMMKAFDSTLLLKKQTFTFIFMIIFGIINILLIKDTINPASYLYDNAFYSPFIIQLHQYHRLVTSLFLSQGMLSIILSIYLFYIYNSFVEIKIGTKKTIILYILGIIGILLSMLCVERNTIFIGSFPLLSLVIGAYLGVILLPSERKYLISNIMKNIILLVLYLFIIFTGGNSALINIISLFLGIGLVMALNNEGLPIKKPYLVSMILILFMMIGLYFIPQQTLARNITFEKDYLQYKNLVNPQQALIEKDQLNKYYQRIGVINYDE
ncbi:MAG: rhomboid family intramembrane serine protease [Bacilli bacterium]|jgi:rhomboid protease GluP|nr:rhomboid family intramembrane serine protease [Bacilli bacterium]